MQGVAEGHYQSLASWDFHSTCAEPNAEATSGFTYFTIARKSRSHKHELMDSSTCRVDSISYAEFLVGRCDGADDMFALTLSAGQYQLGRPSAAPPRPRVDPLVGRELAMGAARRHAAFGGLAPVRKPRGPGCGLLDPLVQRV